MAFAQASNCSMVASSVLSPHAAIFNTFSTTGYTSSSRLSPTAAEFVSSTNMITTSGLNETFSTIHQRSSSRLLPTTNGYVVSSIKTISTTHHTRSSRLSPTASEFVLSSTDTVTTSTLSPYASPFVSMSTTQTEYSSSLQSTCSVSTAPFEMTSESVLSPRATSFVPMSSCEMTPESTLSPQATPFVPMSPSEMIDESVSPPHAVIFKHTPTEQTPCCGNVTQLYSVLPHKYRPGMERIERVIESCEATLISQYTNLKQHEEECARHYDAFLQWKYFERYDEPYEYQDIESLKSLADARDFQCTKCHSASLELKQQFVDTYDKYMRLIAMHGRASIDFAST